MRHGIRFAIAVLLCVGVASAADKAADAKKKDQAKDAPVAAQPDMKAMQEMMLKLAQTGPVHEQLQKLVGNWTCECRSYCDPATGGTLDKPNVTKGKAEFTPLLGGRFVQQKFQGEMDGQKFEGVGIAGFDNGKQKTVGVWMDSMGTGIMEMEGDWDAGSKTLTEMASYEMPFGVMKFRMVTKYASDDEFTMTMAAVEETGEKKVMEITYKRGK